MIRSVNESELRRIGLMLWATSNSCSWAFDDYDDHLPRAFCSAIVANIAYCLVTEDEKERHMRAKVVPSLWHQQLVAQQQVDVFEVLRSADLPEPRVFRTKRFVSIALELKGLVFIGVRGTQFAYDWFHNLRILKRRGSSLATGIRLHTGFMREAEKLEHAMEEFLSLSGLPPARGYCIGGHSLGGAVAAVLLQSRWFLQGSPQHATRAHCYVFGAPRIAGTKAHQHLVQPLAIRRDLDIVPRCPPRSAGYSNFSTEMTTRGSSFPRGDRLEWTAFSKWLGMLALHRIPRNHSMESYRDEIRSGLKESHARISGYLDDLEDPSL